MQPYEQVKYLRKKILKISQEVFAKKINISRSNLGNIETNKVKLTDRVINDICEAYSVNKEWLLNGQEPMFIEPNKQLINELESVYKTLNEANRKYLYGYAYRLLEEQNNNKE